VWPRARPWSQQWFPSPPSPFFTSPPITN
jgi:hypothetical protein